MIRRIDLNEKATGAEAVLWQELPTNDVADEQEQAHEKDQWQVRRECLGRATRASLTSLGTVSSKDADDEVKGKNWFNVAVHPKASFVSTGVKVTGKVIEKTGAVLGNKDMEARGKAENVDGQIEHKVGEVKAVFGK